MKKIYNYIMAVSLGAVSLATTSCIDETEPTSSVTAEQLSASSKATEALLWAMPAKLVQYACALGSDRHDDWGVGSLMHARDVMGDEYVVTTSSYNWYTSWEQNTYMSENYVYSQIAMQTYYKSILAANNMVDAVDEESASDAQKGMLGAGYAFRAFLYLDAARMFEYLPTDGTKPVNSKGNNVQGLTMPIVTNLTTEEESRSNPRVDHFTMFNFIIDDLDKAEELIPNLTQTAKTVPHLNVVYGLKARAYLWHASFMEELGASGVPSQPEAGNGAMAATEAYAKAAEYARKAIELGQNSPLTKDEWLSTSDGFNKAVSSWMMCMSLVKESDAVQAGIINWTSWCSNETTYGYASAGPIVKASPAFYNGISDNDFRKLSFKAPAGSKLAGKEPHLVDNETFDGLPDYASFKFRPGSGNMEDFNVGSAVDIPLMRIEEMYFIEAEAVAHTNPAQGAALLNAFMNDYRCPGFDARTTEKDAVIAAIIKQKRIEFWGEGISFYDIKRLNIPVTRLYEGSNFSEDGMFNTTTRPAWMNLCLVRNEGNSNEAVKNWNSPDPSDCYKKSSEEEGKEAQANPFEANAAGRGLKKPITFIK